MADSRLPGHHDLATLLQTLQPTRDPEVYVFLSLPNVDVALRTRLRPIGLFAEAEGTTLIVPEDAARANGYKGGGRFCRITLTVHSSLEAVGLTAAVATCLAEQGISANMVAAYYHDHVFVPVEDAAQAMAALQRLMQDAQA